MALAMELRGERWRKRREAAERWKDNNRTYYLEQKRRLAGRPEYLAKRRATHALRVAQRNSDDPPRWPAGVPALSTKETSNGSLNDIAITNEARD